MMVHPPNSFIQYWTAKELRAWLKELQWRIKYPDIWKDLSVPTLEQTKAEFRRRRMKLYDGAIK